MTEPPLRVQWDGKALLVQTHAQRGGDGRRRRARRAVVHDAGWSPWRGAVHVCLVRGGMLELSAGEVGVVGGLRGACEEGVWAEEEDMR